MRSLPIRSRTSPDVCAPCARRDRNAADAAVTLPSDVWERAEVLQALKDRHFGRLMLALRKACSPEMTQTEIGRVLPPPSCR